MTDKFFQNHVYCSHYSYCNLVLRKHMRHMQNAEQSLCAVLQLLHKSIIRNRPAMVTWGNSYEIRSIYSQIKTYT